MVSWTLKTPGGDVTLTTEELALWARAKRVSGTTLLRDQHALVWRARDVPGVFSRRRWLVALVLSIFFGFLAADRFYLGRIGSGLVKLLTLGGLGLWLIIDIVLISLRRLDDGDRLPLG